LNTKPLILFLSALPLQTGGVESFLIQLTRELQKDFNFVLASPATQSYIQAFEAAGGKCSHWQVGNALDRSARRSLRALVNHLRPTLVHIHDARAGFIARLTLKSSGIPVIYTTNLPPYYYRWNTFTRLRQGVYAAIETFLNHFATDAVVYPALRVYDEAMQKGYAPASRAKRLPYGIDLTPFLMDRVVEAQSLRLEKEHLSDVPIVATVARHSFEKNIGLLIEAARILHSSGHKFVVWICGQGPETKELILQAAGLESCVRFLGYCDDIPLILQTCDIFVLPSRYEVQPLSIMEAQASGKPCVVSNVGDMPEMVKDGQYGYVFPEGDAVACAQALEKLLSDAPLRNKMGKAARERALIEYSVAKMADAYKTLYQEMLSTKTSP